MWRLLFQEPQSTDPDAKKDELEGEEVEFDDWMFDFADLFRQQLGIDPDGHVSLHNEGLDTCTEAMEVQPEL